MKIFTHEFVIYDRGWVFEWRPKQAKHKYYAHETIDSQGVVRASGLLKVTDESTPSDVLREIASSLPTGYHPINIRRID